MSRILIWPMLVKLALIVWVAEFLPIFILVLSTTNKGFKSQLWGWIDSIFSSATTFSIVAGAITFCFINYYFIYRYVRDSTKIIEKVIPRVSSKKELANLLFIYGNFLVDSANENLIRMSIKFKHHKHNIVISEQEPGIVKVTGSKYAFQIIDAIDVASDPMKTKDKIECNPR